MVISQKLITLVMVNTKWQVLTSGQSSRGKYPYF